MFEVVVSLLQGGTHPRLLAKKLGVNHMTINRRFKDLLDANVVDYTEVGKNKTYFLKKNIEAREYVFMAEHYQLIKAVDEHPQLRRVIEKIQSDRRIPLAVLFGSYAKGVEKETSDIDIHVETKSRKVKEELESLDDNLSIKIGEFNKDSLLAKEIEKNHVIIKGVEDYYEKTEFFCKD